jgi:hypothetical protein
MVQELVAWFEDKGSQGMRVKVIVEESGPGGRGYTSVPYWRQLLARWRHRDRSESGSFRNAEPVMEGHAIPMPEVIALMQHAGGRVLDVQRMDVAGPHWISYRYFVTK